MFPSNRFSDPPRAIPPSVLLKVLASPDLMGSLVAFVPAAALVVTGAINNDTLAKAAPLFFGAVFLVAGLMVALPALARSVQALGRMRNGFLALGHINSFHFSWSPEDEEIRYVEFLSNWKVIVSTSQQRKITNAALKVSVRPFVVIFGLCIALLAILLLKWLTGDMKLDREVALIFATMIVVMGFFIWLLLSASRHDNRKMTNAMAPYLVSDRTPQPTNELHDDLARRLTESAAKRRAHTQVKGNLSGGSTLELICQVEYLVRGERRTSEGRMRHTFRLDPAGMEPLLFDPSQSKVVTLLSGLPDGVYLDARGKWEEVPAARPALAIAVAGLVAGTALVGLGLNLSWLMAIIRS